MSGRCLPILDYPGSGRAVIEPVELLARRRRVPSRFVLCFFLEVIQERLRAGRLEPVCRLHGEGEPVQVYRAGRGGSAVGVVFPGVGAPFAAATLEELIALGAERFVCCGGAGVLDASIPAGELILPTSAVRDEGTSYHYQRTGRLSRPHPVAVAALVQACRKMGIPVRKGRTWTTDAVYRETARMVRSRRAEGCVCVEMEASALFAVARFRKVTLAQILYAGDDVSGTAWQHRDWNRLSGIRRNLFELSLRACRSTKG